ncbi:hypothetical protein MMYC01_203898 [Madurella mycetomatis]|uniref:Uncharacterized protein n=1 Tax=Madurella mycetomatis TaxID=100816 RepID=A0A175WBM0_9PEZI|nr:hypothetical protein MMYC01_203898 [Madurella mycetomatis]
MAPLNLPHLADIFETAKSTIPTKTLPLAQLLHIRQSDPTVTIITGDGSATEADNSTTTEATTLTGGAIAGIVIGSIAGLLLLLWIIRSCSNLGAPPGSEARPGWPWYGGVRDEYPPRHRSGSRSRSRHSYHGHRHHRHRRHGRSRSRRASVVEVTEAPPVVVRDSRRSRSRGHYGYGDRVESRSRSRGRY